MRAREGEHRLAISFRSRRDLADRLDAFLAGQARPGIAVGRAGEGSRLVWVFSGMGSQWPGMARDLLRQEPLFHAHLSRIDRALRPELGWSVLTEIAAGTGERWSEADVALPLLFAIEATLADLWRSWGIEPDAVVGHSFGEVVAAYVAGALDLEEAARVTVHYSRTLAKIDGLGAMGVVELPPGEARDRMAARGLRSEVAGWLSPASATIAGTPGDVEAFLAEVKAQGRFAARVTVAIAAAHTAQLEPHLPAMREALAGLTPRTPAVPLISTLTGGPLDRPLDGDYWVDNLRNPVLLAQAVEHLLRTGHDLFLSVDAHPVLATPLEQCIAAAGVRARVLPSLRKQEDGRPVLFDSLGALWAAGRPVRWEDAEEKPELLPLSARTPEALADLARATAGVLRESGEGTLGDSAWTAAARRSHHEHRLAMVARSRAEMAAKLDAWAGGEPVAGAAAARAGRERPRVVFAFSGQGPQWKGMGRQLFAEEPRFRETVEQCDRLLRPWLGFSVLERVEAEEDALDHTEVAQAALFSLQVGLTVLWRSWGIEPDAVVGHSIGEVAAAWASGALSLEEAARVVALRGRSMEPARGLGKMAAVELPEDEVRAALVHFGDRLAVAAVNAPSSTTVAGDPQALEELIGRLTDAGATCRRLRVEYAFHTAQMEPYDAELEIALADLRPRAAAVPLVSTVTGARAEGTDLGATYWRRNVREPVRFADAVGTLEEEGYGLFLEIGPHPVLAASIAQVFDARGREAAVHASLRRGRDERETLLEALGSLYALGSPIDWRGVHPDGGRLVRLPAYPFQRQRYWFEVEKSTREHIGSPVAPATPETDVERLLAEQLDAFNRMVALQLDVLGRNDL
ncbi:MAG TPA: acyltransferase domain-containing protein [Thermoanaerobaculia bacterium]|nr:acyltransferase domain-containing protein [Thermoanaerobaculia bacterium]